MFKAFQPDLYIPPPQPLYLSLVTPPFCFTSHNNPPLSPYSSHDDDDNNPPTPIFISHDNPPYIYLTSPPPSPIFISHDKPPYLPLTINTALLTQLNFSYRCQGKGKKRTEE